MPVEPHPSRNLPACLTALAVWAAFQYPKALAKAANSGWIRSHDQVSPNPLTIFLIGDGKIIKLVAQLGVEPKNPAYEAGVLPLHYRASENVFIHKNVCNRTPSCERPTSTHGTKSDGISRLIMCPASLALQNRGVSPAGTKYQNGGSVRTRT